MVDVPTQSEGSNPYAGINHRDMDKYFNELRRNIAAERRNARHTLSPGAIRNAIRSGKLPPNLEVIIGSKEGGDPFTIDDLKTFAKTRDRVKKKFSKYVGVTMAQLVAASLAVDVERANTEIRSARVYRVRGDVLTLNVTASQKYDADWHQVKVQLLWWNEAMTGARSPMAAVKKACQGAVKFDCDCGRHQYWYRYIATVGGFALKPFEKDFPKVRNPSGVGACCKHVLKAFKALMSPTTQAVLTKEMKRQAEQVGFSSDSRTQFLTKKDQKMLDRARPGKINQQQAQMTMKKFEAAKKRFMTQLNSESKETLKKSTQKQRQAMKRRAKELDHRERELKKRERELARLESKAKEAAKRHTAKKAVRKKKPNSQQTIIDDLRNKLEFARTFGTPVSAIYAQIADVNSMSVADVKKLAEGLK